MSGPRTLILSDEDTVTATVVSPRLRQAALRLLRSATRTPQLMLETRAGTSGGGGVQTLIVGGARAAQTVGTGAPVWGEWDRERRVLRADACCAAYSVDGELAFGDEGAWIGRDRAGRHLALLLSEAELPVAAKALQALDGRFESRVQDSHVSEGFSRAADLSPKRPQLIARTLRIPFDVDVVEVLLDVLRTGTSATHEGWDRRGARELRNRIEECLDAGPKLREVAATAAKGDGRRRPGAARRGRAE